MALMISTTTELAHQYQTYFNKTLLDRAMQATVLDQFSAKFSFPKEAGAKTMRMFRLESGDAANVSTLSEGVALSTYSEVGLDYVEATLVQYGQVYKMSDVLTMTNLFSTLNAAKSRMAEEQALHADKIVRNVIIAGITGSTEKIYAGGATTFNGLVALDATTGVLTIKDLLRAMTQLEINRAPRKNGEYFAIVAPQIAYDLMLDTQFFIPVGTYQDKSNIVKGEVGKWFNVRVVINTVPFKEDETNGTEGTYSSNGTIYSTIVVGSDCYGTPIMAGNSPYSPRIYVADKSDKVDVLNQYTMAGWKSYWAALVLNAKWGVVLRSISGYA